MNEGDVNGGASGGPLEISLPAWVHDVVDWRRQYPDDGERMRLAIALSRENVERMFVLGDWAEEVFAANIVFEPLVGELFRSGFVMHTAPAQGDFVTPTIFGLIENEYDRDLNATRDMFTLLAEDEEHGEENKQVMQEWLDKWVPLSVKAAQGLEPIWSEPEVQVVSFEESFENAKSRFEGIVSELGLQLTEELVQQ